MLLLNISTDEVAIYWENYFQKIHRNEVDKKLWPALIQIYRNLNHKDFIVVNWPGGFTNLRVGSLTLNLLQNLSAGKCNFFEISKISLLRFFYQNWFLPRFGAIYIWQKKNIWLYDFEEQTYQTVSKEFDYSQDTFLDSVFEKTYFSSNQEKQIQIWYNTTWIEILYKNQKSILPFDSLLISKVSEIVPYYGVDPVIWWS